jgi:AraC-like DNA-binding protein
MFYALYEPLCEAKSHSERVQIVEAHLLRRLDDIPKTTHYILAQQALALVNTRRNDYIQTLMGQSGYSRRTLERLFQRSIGIAPQEYVNMLRFFHTFKTLSQGTSDTLTRLCYDAGYYDQAHFVRYFHRFTGFSPTAYLKRFSDNPYYATFLD